MCDKIKNLQMFLLEYHSFEKFQLQILTVKNNFDKEQSTRTLFGCVNIKCTITKLTVWHYSVNGA